MLGGDKFTHNLGNQLIIKCHECGDTDLRNVSFFRTASGEPSGYVCGNGHETWGAIDEWVEEDRWGPSDTFLQPVKDEQCETINCGLPESIEVVISGINGVQVRESCAQSCSEDVRTRSKMPIQHCGPCCESTINDNSNSPWSIDCGCDTASGPCHKSHDGVFIPYPDCISDMQTTSFECFPGVFTTASIDKDSIQVFTNPPANPDAGGWFATQNSCAAITTACSTQDCPYVDPITFGFFAGGYPDAYSGGPSFIVQAASSTGDTWSNIGLSIIFIVRDQRHFHWKDPCDQSKGCCWAGKRTVYVAKRTHPTADATGHTTGLTWSLSQEGIADPVIEYTCGVEECSAMWESPNINPANYLDYCDSSNASLPCTSCNDSVGPISVTYCEGRGGDRRFWPFRVPSQLDPDMRAQLIRGNPPGYASAGECNCREANICDEPDGTMAIFPTYCTQSVYYPDCLASGTYKCAGVDARYRVPCANPPEYFTVSMANVGSLDILKYRYSVDWTGVTATSDIKFAVITFNPIYEGRVGGAETFSFPESPNPHCAGLARAGYVPYFGDPQPTSSNPGPYWFEIGSPIRYTAGAIGIRTARLGQIFELPDQTVQQPHCARRVRSPNLSKRYPYYQVNTNDLSGQRLILDRFRPTNEYYDYMFSGVPIMSEPHVTGQPFINRQGDKGLFDLLTGQLYPYAFISRSGSIEEPELIAVIHSEKGKGGQVGFQTMPVTMETEFFDDHADTMELTNGYCDFKTRIAALGYGVMYPLIDDPIWSTEVDPGPAPTTYDPNDPYWNPATKRRAFEWPVFVPGTGYEIGDKIEFRAWRTMQSDYNNFDPSPGAGEIERIWEEDCVELIIATATIKELNDERIKPSGLVQPIPNMKIAVTSAPSGLIRYRESWKLNSVTILDNNTSGYDLGDTFEISFNDSDAMDGIHYDIKPVIAVSGTGVNGKIDLLHIEDPGSYYKVVRTGGIRWFEFDEVDDDTGDLKIAVGNCPCTYDICESGCGGCVSKDMYPSGHLKIDAINDGFPGSPWHACITNENIKDSQDKLIKLFCPSTIHTLPCNSSCTFTARYGSGSIDSLGWMVLDSGRCAEPCTCTGEVALPTAYGQTASGGCSCGISATMDGISLVEPFGSNPYSAICWPTNGTWEFYSDNYARTACLGNPIIPGSYAYTSGQYVMPYRRPQYRQAWLPNISGFQQNFEKYLPEETTRAQKNEVIDSFLGFDSCNPGKYDRFRKSHKWPTKPDSGKGPCRKQLNPGDPLPSGASRLDQDDYCRVYGFYQQREPECTPPIYRGQYIMRAAQKASGGIYTFPELGDCQPSYYPNELNQFTDCEPIIEDIVIGFNKMEAQFDISVGAPYNQDFLIPENLPMPFVGADGKKEVRADSWDVPSLTGVNNPVFYDHGFYEPNRYHAVKLMILPENQQDLGIGEQPIKSPVFTVNSLMSIYDVDYADNFPGAYDVAHSGITDWPDPRNNCRFQCLDYETPKAELYPAGNVPIPDSGIQSNFVQDCLYPWENYKAGDKTADHFAMFANNSAELTLGEIERCDSCIGSVLINNRADERLYGPFYSAYGQYISYSYMIHYSGEQISDTVTYDYYVAFRAFGTESDSFVLQDFRDVIDEYIDIWHDRYRDDMNIDEILSSDIHRSLLWNMVFEGASNKKLQGLTKVEIFYFLMRTENMGSYGNRREVGAYLKAFWEERCEYNQTTGSIKSINVLNGGSGYAFEIEERVPLSGVVQNLKDGTFINFESVPLKRNRRRETYAMSGIDIAHTGTTYQVNDIINISFNDSDYARNGIVVLSEPSIRVTGLTDEGSIEGWEIANSGEFYKYMKTGQHRAFPVAMVLSNYWDYPNGAQNMGRHAKLTPVIGVDPSDSGTYGKIKRVDVEFGGMEYTFPGQYWAINTKLGDYDDYDNLKTGLDLQHLVDPCKFNIAGDGFDSAQVQEYYNWMNYPENDPNGTVHFPERQSVWIESNNEEFAPSIGDPFVYSKKYYLRTKATEPHVIKWKDRVRDWSTVLISGICPVDASGGLLNRTYDMALVEEAYIHSNRAHTGFCTASECEEYIDYNDISCTNDGAIYPGEQRVKECGTPCPVFTVYDAHRFNIEGTAQLKEDIMAEPGPWLLGCPQRLPLDTAAKKQLFCYDAYQITYGGQLQTQGYTTWDMFGNPNDWCANAEYSLYAEFGKWNDGGGPRQNVPAMRIKAISYKMKDPIKMKVSYNMERDYRGEGALPIDYKEESCKDDTGKKACGGCE